MSLSPQLRAIGPVIRILAVVIDAAGSSGWPLVLGDDDDPNTKTAFEHPLVETARLCEARSGDGWNVTEAERVMAERGWHSADDIFNEADIPEKHRRVIELALWGDPTKHKGRMFTTREIAEMTGHPERTVKLWLSMDMPRLHLLAAALESVA